MCLKISDSRTVKAHRECGDGVLIHLLNQQQQQQPVVKVVVAFLALTEIGATQVYPQHGRLKPWSQI